MKFVITVLAALAATPSLAHSGAHLHPHAAAHWLVVILAVATVGGTMALAFLRGGK